MTSPLFQFAAAVARSASATVPPALALAYDRSQAAAAIVRAVQRWREAKAGMTSTDPAAALDAVWDAGETLSALRED